MSNKWDELSDKEQKLALSLLHEARHAWNTSHMAQSGLPDFEDRKLLMNHAINHIDGLRRKFSIPGMIVPGVGVATFLFNEDNEFLVGKRKGSHGAGTWGLPGGRLEISDEAVRRASLEVQEETGVYIDPIYLAQRGWGESSWNDPVKGQQHWITLFYYIQLHATPVVKVMEETKCEGWKWITLKDARVDDTIFAPLRTFLLKQEYFSEIR